MKKKKSELRVWEPNDQFVDFIKKHGYKYKVICFNIFEKIEDMRVYDYSLGTYDGNIGLAGNFRIFDPNGEVKTECSI